jgi:hypothetical protein
MHRCADALEGLGFVVTDRQQAAQVTKIVGYQPRRTPARMELPDQKSVDLRGSLLWLSEQTAAHAGVVRSVVSIWIWCALLRRDVLCLAQHVFTWLERYDEEVALLWPSVRRELRCMGKVVPLVYADVGARLGRVMYASDAMGASEADHGGYGVVGRVVSEALVEEVFTRGSELGYTVARLEGGGGLKFPEKPCRRTKPHTLLPRAIFEPEDEWLPTSAGRWAYADHITLGECRAVLKTLDPILAVSKAHRQKIICLEDNQPTNGGLHQRALLSTGGELPGAA